MSQPAVGVLWGGILFFPQKGQKESRYTGQYELASPDYVRGYLEGVDRNGSDENVLKIFFLTKLVL